MSDWYAPNQQAVRADGSGPAEEGSGGAGDGAPSNGNGEPNLDAMTKDELLAYAQEQGIDVDASMTKAEIREAIGA
jgi:hypothetical protein